MIGTNTTSNRPLPDVFFPVAWPIREWHRTAALLERVNASVSEHWELLAPVVERARIHGGVGVLRVTLDPRHAVAITRANGTWMTANAMAVWMRELPTPGACSLLPGSAQVNFEKPPTAREVSVVCAVLDDAAPMETNTAVSRMRCKTPHSEWLSAALAERPEYPQLPYVVVALDPMDGVKS